MNRRGVTPRLAGRGAFAAVIVVFLAVVSQTAIPSPFYPLYARQFHLAPVATTVVFAAYVVGIVVTLLTVGALSDYVGRRPVLLAGCLCGIAALVMFLGADGFTGLVAARVLQGVSIGTSNAALAAALVDAAPAGNTRLASVLAGALPPAALALGALLGGIAIEVAARPAGLAYGISIAAVLCATVLTLLLPEKHPRRSGAVASLRPRMGVPRGTRRAFTAVVGSLIAGWAMAGLYLALMPSVLAAAWPQAAPLARELPLSAFLSFAALAGAVLIRMREHTAIIIALPALIIGAGVAGWAIVLPTVPTTLLAAGTVIAGFGFGGTFQASLRHLVAATEPGALATVMAAALTIAFLAFGLPAVAAGALVPAVGVSNVAVGYAGFVFLVAIVATAVYLAAHQTGRTRRT